MYREPLAFLSLVQVSFAQDFCKFNKTPSDDTFLEEPTGGVFDVGYCCCFTSLDVFTCPGYLSLLPALHPGFPGPWRPPPALSSTLATFDCFTFARLFHHSFTASATVLSGCFLPTVVFYLALLTHILSRFCDSDAGRNSPSRILFWPALTKLFVAAEDWRMVLNYSFCRYKTIGFKIVPVCYEVKTY